MHTTLALASCNLRASKVKMRALAIILLTQLLVSFPSGGAHAAEGASVKSLATAFGKFPQMWGARLSPDGSRVSFLHMYEDDFPVLLVFTAGADSRLVLASKPDVFDINWCRWANNERLLCGFYGIAKVYGYYLPETRLVAVNADGTKKKVLLQKQLQKTLAQFQDDVIDWMPDDPANVLIEVPNAKGTGVARLNIYSGRVATVARNSTNARDWVSDGYGSVRLRHYMSTEKSRWQYRLAGERQWRDLHESRMTDLGDIYHPLGFGDERNTLLVFKRHHGRLALWAEDLARNREDELIFSHPNVDVDGYTTLGKRERLVGIGYSTDKPHYHFFDERIEEITRRIQLTMPGKVVGVIDESWDRKFYLIHISSDQDAGRYYRFNVEQDVLEAMLLKRPDLHERDLAMMRPIRYPAADGVEIPGYLTLPPHSEGKNLPAVVMPHGGPQSRDRWDFDWFAQFFAAAGYAVLQSNFRGSGGYGSAWAGEGGFKAWRSSVGDIIDGSRWLIENGIADPERMCIVGWSYGGYAALLSAIEAPELYKCVVSIAGVTDPSTLINDYRNFLNKRVVREFVGNDKHVLNTGSPLKRASEIQVPVLMFHGKEDINVSVKHSKNLHKALKRAGVSSDLVLYDQVAHNIWRERYRIDNADKDWRFLARHTGGAQL